MAPRDRKQKREAFVPTEWDKEREWVPLWLAGPLCALLGVLGSIAILRAVLALRDAIAKALLG